MALIDFKKIIYELSDESFLDLKKKTSPYITFYFANVDAAAKETYLEKLGEYFKCFEEKNTKYKDNDLPVIYVETLSSLMQNRTKNGSVAEKYYVKNLRLKDTVYAVKEDALLQLLEDETKIFVCFYDALVKYGCPVNEVYFLANEAEFDRIKERFIGDKPEASTDKKALLKKVDGLFSNQFKNIADNANEKRLENKKNISRKMNNKKEDVKEPIHDVIEFEKESDIFTKRIAVLILLCIMYQRVIDFETGRVE